MDKPAWKRVAQHVVARRVELNLKTTTALADKAGLSSRMLGDVENARRDNYSDGAKVQIERALDWVYGSIDDVLAGQEPTPIENASPSNRPALTSDQQLVSQYLHPARRHRVVQIIENDPDFSAVLQRVLETGEVGDDDRPRLERVLEDMRIAAFPALYEKLTRSSQLRIADFGGQVQAEEILERSNDDVEATKESAASAKVNKNEKTVSADDPELRRLAAVSAQAAAKLKGNGVDDHREEG